MSQTENTQPKMGPIKKKKNIYIYQAYVSEDFFFLI